MYRLEGTLFVHTVHQQDTPKKIQKCLWCSGGVWRCKRVEEEKPFTSQSKEFYTYSPLPSYTARHRQTPPDTRDIFESFLVYPGVPYVRKVYPSSLYDDGLRVI